MKNCRSMLILILICFIPELAAQDLITNVFSRNKINLNGNWKIIVDPYENGYYTFHLNKSTKGYFLDYEPAPGERPVEFKFSDSHTLLVPGDWNTQRDELFFYEGTIWYRKDFEFKKEPDQKTYLYFGAANYKAVVYLNGEEIGTHEGGFTPFNFDVTQKIREGSNYLVVKVDNYRRTDRVPTVMTDWWNYGGLTRDVFIINVNQTFIKDYFIQLKKNSFNEIEGWVKLEGDNQNKEVKIEIPGIKVSYTSKTNSEGTAPVAFKSNPELWSPENPKLYDVIISSGREKIYDKIGFRSITARGEKIYLNGKEIYLRGISLHEVAPFRAGRAHSEGDADVLFRWIKELGCNYARLAHYPHNEYMVRKADELGILLWTEVPVYWAIDYQSEDTYRSAERQIMEMITRDKNRAAVILWSLANETPVRDDRNKFLKRIADQVRSADSTRLLTAALRIVYKDSLLTIDDPLGNTIDILGVNQYIGWYEGVPSRAREIMWKSNYNKPVLVSEFGADALYNLHGTKDERWTEEYQANLYEEQINMLRKVDFVVGMSPWILTDFLSPRRPLYGIQDWFNRKGLISDNGEKKKAFFVLQKFYEEKKSGRN